jgi:plasmid stability protein
MAQHRWSIEAGHREILRQALLLSEPNVILNALLVAMPLVRDDADFARLPDQEREVERLAPSSIPNVIDIVGSSVT